MTDIASLKIKVDATSAKKASKDLDGLTKKGATTEKGAKKLSKGFTGVKNSIAAIDGPLGGISSRLGTFSTIVSNGNVLLGGTVAALVGLGAVLVKTTSHMAELEVATAKTAALLKATGFAAGFSADELDGMARSLALNTLASSDAVRSAQNALLTFKSISGPIFQQTIKLSQDMASVFGGDIKSAAVQLGKALEDPITGLSLLRRVGVSFNEQQKEQIKLFVEGGEVVKAQALILGTLEKQIGGAGGAAAGGLSGAFDTLGQRFEEFLERVDRASSSTSTMTKVINQWGIWLNDVNQGFGEAETSASLFEERLDKIFEARKLQASLDAGIAGHRKRIVQGQINALNKEIDLLGKKIGLENESTLETAKQVIATKELAEQNAKIEASKANQIKLDKLFVDEDKKRSAIDPAFAQQRMHFDQLDAIEAFNVSAGEKERLREAAFAQHMERMAAIAGKGTETTLQETEEGSKKSTELLTDTQTSALSTTSDIFGNMASIAEQGGKDQFATYKAFAIAQALVSTSLAATNALAITPTPLGIGLAATVAGMGAINVGSIASQEYSGARAMGGQVSSGESYLVGERGPEVLTMGSGGGNITPNHKMGGQEVKVTNVFQISTGVAGTVQAELARMMPQITRASKMSVQAAITEGGSMARQVGRRS